MIDEYEITTKTYALIALNENKTEVIEESKRFIVNKKATKVVKRSCEFYGCTLEGRIQGSKKQLGMKYKLPIIVENTNELIFFPTISPRDNNCSWIALKNIKNYREKNYKTIIEFTNGIEILCPISIEALENQINRATRLMVISKQRCEMLK